MDNIILSEILLVILVTLFGVYCSLVKFEPRSKKNEYKPGRSGQLIALVGLGFVSTVVCHELLAKYYFDFHVEFDFYTIYMAVLIFPSSIFYLIYYRRFSIEVFDDKLIVHPIFKKRTELYFSDVDHAERGKFPPCALVYRKDGTKVKLFYNLEKEDELLSQLFEKKVISQELFDVLPRMVTNAGRKALESLWVKVFFFVLGIVFFSISIIVCIAVKDDLFFNEGRITKVSGDLFEVSEPEYGSGITFILQSDTAKEYYLDFVSPTHFDESIYNGVKMEKPVEIEFIRENNGFEDYNDVLSIKQENVFLFSRDYFFYISKSNALAGFSFACFLFFSCVCFFRLVFGRKT